MAAESDKVEAIEACRTCGIYYMTTSNYLKHLFQSPIEQPEMMLIRLELAQWKVEVSENDAFPQYVCSTCIHEFQKVFKFRAACIETQEQFRNFYNLGAKNHANIKIKTEASDPDEDKPLCDFIYVDELSDTEYDGATPFNIPHVPIKEELIEAATIPMEESGQPINMVESASGVVAQPGPSSQVSQLNSQNESITKTPASVVIQTFPEKVECKLCQHLSSNQEEHEQHLQRAHDIRDLECHICGKKFKNSTAARLKFHMKWHTLNKHVKCTQCTFVCNSKDALQDHKRANHAKINCKICGIGVLAKKMKSHLRNHELLTKYPCEYCTEVLTSDSERETHIWQIHANENNNPTTTSTSSQLGIVQEVTENIFKISQEETMCQEPQEDEIKFKFICAHCDARFTEQVDLEKHNQEHRPRAHLATNELVTLGIGQELAINGTKISQNDYVDDGTPKNITTFEDYDNELDQYEDVHQNIDSIVNITPAAQQCNELKQEIQHFNDQLENIENEDQELTSEKDHNEEQIEYHKSSATSSDTENSDTSDLESETGGNLPAYTSSDLYPFACAKCAKTFKTIEQLRQHHEQHLNSDQSQGTTNKLKFKCTLCGKSFDLKFSLNRHLKKHKNAPL